MINHDKLQKICYSLETLGRNGLWVQARTFYYWKEKKNYYTISYKQKIQAIRRNQVYFSSSNVSTDTTVIVKD